MISLVKKTTFSAMVIFTLICSMSIITLAQSKIEQTSTLPSLEATTRPVFYYSGTDNTTVLVDRNDHVYNGTVLLLEEDQPLYSNVTTWSNVTIWYTFVGGDNESAPLLFGDDGTNTPESLSWEDSTLMTYDNESTVELGLELKAYYNYTFNLSSSFISFYARYGEYEDAYQIPNLITRNVWLESYFVQDEYTQYEDIDMDIILHDYNISEYGLMYREVDPDHSLPFENVTYILDAEGSQQNVTATITNTYDVDTQLEIRSFITQYDNITQEYRTLVENKVRLVTLIEGDPVLSLESEMYSNSRDISIFWYAEGNNSEITGVDVDWDDGTVVESIANVSNPKIIHSYASTGEYTIEVTAYTFLGLGATTDTITILIEDIAPTGVIQLLDEDGESIPLNATGTANIVVEKKELQFKISGTDTGGSGVAKLVVITDEGNIVESPSDGVITVPFLEYGYHVITFKVYDVAGNEYEYVVSVNLIEKELPTYGGVPFPFGIVTIVGLISVALIYLKKRK